MGECHEVAITGYAVAVQTGQLAGGALAADIVERLPNTSTFVVITDSNVHALYGDTLVSSLTAKLRTASSNAKVIVKAISPGEQSKSRPIKETLEDWMLASGCDRQSCIVALGGGVVGDLAGFVAATFMRGIKFVQVPTSLLAMVDSSIGGKTGLDTPAGKNLVGSFHRPVRVYLDPALLKTLPIRELRNGMAEIIKAGAIWSAELFETLEANAEKIQELDLDVLEKVILASAQIKCTVVNEDERESGLRAILNFGHSVGHGIEALLQPDWLHGECVAVGMVKETEIARGLGDIAPDALNRLLACLAAYKLPVKIPSGVAVDDIMAKMAVDKKNCGGVKRIVLLERIGACSRGACAVEDRTIRRALSNCVEVKPSGPATATIRVPGSKSISNRVLLMAALGKGTCRIKGLLHSDDTKVMIDALRSLGAPSLTFEENGKVLVVQGAGGKLTAAKNSELYLSNAGTASRFLTTACTVAEGEFSIVTGNKRMQERPIKDLVNALRANGCAIDYLKSDGCPPLRVSGGGLPGGDISLSASISSQFVSSILISAPYAKTPVHLTLVGQVVSGPYISMTIALMRQFGVDVQQQADGSYIIPNTDYTNPPVFEVESDASSASYPLGIAAITGGSVEVESVGTESLQGDAKFCEVMRAMGCEVVQTATSTRVTGPPRGQLKAVEVDMSDVTDTFMTAAVVMAATPKGTKSTITNIANQRVKECDRIAAMATELAKCGVFAEELPDGLIVHGSGLEPPAPLADGAGIFCYKDHRIAMSFGVLGCLWPGVRILDKDCTDKTYPAFWDDLENVFNTPVNEAAVPEQANDLRPSSVFVVGMRAAGKTTLSVSAARYLSFEFVDLDAVMEDRCGGIKSFVEEKGWEAFRALETVVLKESLASHRTGTVVSCGGGAVESPENRALLREAGLPVVWLRRNIDDIEAFLTSDPTRPAYGEPIRAVWERRFPWYREVSSHEFFVQKGNNNLAAIEQEFSRVLGHVTGYTELRLRSDTFFLSLTFPDLADVDTALLCELCADVHAVELRVDLLEDWSSDFVLSQIAILRLAAKATPIIFTVRSTPQGGKFDQDEDAYWKLLELGRRAGCEILDVEACWTSKRVTSFLESAGPSKTIGSLHFQSTCDDAQTFFLDAKKAWFSGKADIVKLVYTASQASDCFVVHQAASRLSKTGVDSPVIALLMGREGKLSRVVNTFMTPVTHKRLPAAAAPGQLSREEILGLRASLGLVSAKEYFIVGSAVQKSPSPLMHNTGFGLLDLPHTYDRLQTSEFADVVSCLENPKTGGFSVTMPYKEQVVALATHLSPAARAIKAVNTITKDGSKVYGDNTDWIGIHNPVKAALTDKPRHCGLILGAGGTARAACYALLQLGLHRVFVYNRTLSRCEQLCAEFGCEPLDSLDKLVEDGDTKLSVIVSTLPPDAKATVPEHLLQSKPVVLDAVYLPLKTPLLEQAGAAGCVALPGIDMLVAQGVEQTSLWTMRSISEFGDAVSEVVKKTHAAFDPATEAVFPSN
eukprot:m.33341 g.33341  ORF g.33341 m.33341 type:complete len:1512 (-) comp10359_c0_seq2:178-4713(-)